MSSNPFNENLDKNPANYQPLTPLQFLHRAALIYPDHTAIIHGNLRFTYAEFYTRCRRLASALAARGIGEGDTVSVLLANTPAMLEAHYAVPMIGAVLHSINTRLDPPVVAFQLDHANAKFYITDREFAPLSKAALELAHVKPPVVDYDDPEFPQTGERLSDVDYEAFVASGDPEFVWQTPSDEWNAIALNYTSGTTGNPKGVVYHHRGAALMCYANNLEAGMGQHPVYLWTLPMFHCNGWCFPWSLSAVAGTHVCLRWVRAKAMYDAIVEHRVTHLSGAPIVMATLLNAAPEEKRPIGHRVSFNHAAAPPPQAVLDAMAAAGFHLTHLYGLTETYGPAVVNEWNLDWNDLDEDGRAFKRTRQGVRYLALEDLTVMDPVTMQRVPADGETLGEVMFRGNIVMKGYLKNPEGNGRGVRGRLVPLRRSRRALPGRLHPAQGPLQGHHHLGRREHLLDRGRGRALQAPRRRLLRRRRQAGREVGRDTVCVCRAAPRNDGDDRRVAGLVPRSPRQVQVPAAYRVLGGAPHLDRQDSEVQAARDGERGLSKILSRLQARSAGLGKGGERVPLACRREAAQGLSGFDGIETRQRDRDRGIPLHTLQLTMADLSIVALARGGVKSLEKRSIARSSIVSFHRHIPPPLPPSRQGERNQW